MAHLDRLVWADAVAIRAYGLRIGIRVEESAFLPLALARIPSFRVSRSRVVDVLFSIQAGALWTDHRLTARLDDRTVLLDAFESALRRTFVAQARGYQFVHAGCVGWRGRAIVVPGYSHAGKSTLVHALVRAGATYYSDEYAVFDRRGRVHPFGAPIRLRRDSGEVESIDVNGGAHRAARRPPLPVGLVVKTHFQTDSGWRPRPLGAGEVMMALLPHAGSVNRAPASVLSAIARGVAGSAGIETPRGEASEAAARILAYEDGR